MNDTEFHLLVIFYHYFSNINICWHPGLYIILFLQKKNTKFIKCNKRDLCWMPFKNIVVKTKLRK